MANCPDCTYQADTFMEVLTHQITDHNMDISWAAFLNEVACPICGGEEAPFGRGHEPGCVRKGSEE